MYSPQSRERAVGLILEQGRRVATVAQDLGVAEGSLYR
ncbi:transposase [Nocardia vaccinii]